MIKEYNINDYLKDDKELQKAVIQELLEEMKNTNIKNEKLKNFVIWLTKQQYYILPPKIKEKCKGLLLIEGENE